MNREYFEIGEFVIIAPCGCEKFQYRGEEKEYIWDKVPAIQCKNHNQDQAEEIFRQWKLDDPA